METAGNIQALLWVRLTELRQRNPQYSSRAYAKKLGLSSGALTEILNGRRTVSRKIAVRICERLALDPMEASKILSSYSPKPKAPVERAEIQRYLRLTSEQYKVMAEWHHYAILSLMQTADFKTDPAWIATRLGIARTAVERAIRTLTGLGLITIQKNGEWKRSEAGHRSSDDVADASIRQSHRQTLELAAQAMDNRPVAERDLSALTLPLDFEDLPEAKAMIRDFQNKFYLKFSHGRKPREVFRLSVQLFPLTQGVKK